MDIEKVISDIENKSAQIIVAEQGDYYNNEGLLMCGKCNTPKQCRVFILDKERTPYCLCKCESERIKEEEEKQKRIEKIKKLRDIGFPDEEMKNWTFANDDGKNERIMHILHNYVVNFDEMRRNGKGLLLFGGVGTGKTYCAACIENELINREYACLFTSFPRLVNTINGMYDGKQEYIDGLNRFSLLVIDDFSSERDTEYMNEIVYNIIDSRYRSCLPVIITTNLTSYELKNPENTRKQRIYSRLLEMTIPIEVKGEDRRREILKTDYQKYAEILGL